LSDDSNRGGWLSSGSSKENIVRNFIIAGAAAAAIALGASSAYALPPNSPYAIWVPESVDQGVPAPNGAFTGSNFDAAGSSNEGRAAFVSGDSGTTGMLTETPEDRTYYSRGR
jgi:hypothetical protein